MKLTGTALKMWVAICDFFASIHFNRTSAVLHDGVYYTLKEQDHNKIRELLKSNYYIILTRRKSHLTTYLIALMSLYVDGKMSHYTHALMNVEGDIDNNMDYKLIEATAVGVHYSTFMEVFDCDSVVLMSPKGLPAEEWTAVLDNVKSQLGKGYDDLFDIADGEQVSCVEMVYQGMMSLPDAELRWPKLIALIKERKNNLTPQMLYDTGELDVVFEVRR
jgi:hypothetical protein